MSSGWDLVIRSQPQAHEIRGKGAQMRILLGPAERRFEDLVAVFGAGHERPGIKLGAVPCLVWMS